MAPLSLKVVTDDGAVTRTVMFDSLVTAHEAQSIVEEKVLTGSAGKDYGLFLTSADDSNSGIWLEGHRTLDYYMLRDGDTLHYLCRIRNLKVRMLDGSVKTLQVDESKPIGDLMVIIAAKIGIINHDEYGLCREDVEECEEQKPGANAVTPTGTLTLKKKPPKQKDEKLEQLSKKLKTDDNVQWLEQHKTLRELGVVPLETVLLQRRLFVSDRCVDARDPVQLNLLYVQARDAILHQRHPVTEDKAVEFAGIQCQVHYGDFQEDKHKPGFIENLSEFLPEQYVSSWGMEKKILKAYRKHVGLSQLDAKYLYTKTARDLPTYGVTFFLVKEKQKGKKKLVPRLLGINSESILRLDEVTKEILQVWPLTQVKTYHVGKSETFTLNFGDYSEKEYSVKTNDAVRIRDILEGYIDLIRKRLLARHHNTYTESGQILQENIQLDSAHIIQYVPSNINKIVTESFIGPSKITLHEEGMPISHGTHFTTVQQIVQVDRVTNEHHAVAGGVPMRSDMSLDFVRRLNRVNSNSVKIVTLLTDPNETDTEEIRKIVDTIQAEMPSITEGVKDTAEMQITEDAKKKLLDQLNELEQLVSTLDNSTTPNRFNSSELQEAAKSIADLSTQMYFSLDPKTKRRSEFIRRSRQSFIADERTRATLHRASFIAAVSTACHALEDATYHLEKEYDGPVLEGSALDEAEAACVNKMGKLNAAVAQLLASHKDSKNIDYETAMNSINTINELMPELAKDSRGISEATKSGRLLLEDVRTLCDVTRALCASAGDRQKMDDAASKYASVSGKLIYVFGRRQLNPDKENEIIDLAKEVGDQTSLLLVKVNELTGIACDDPAAGEADDAGVWCADAARDLLATTQLTAPTIHEPHCQSALTASAEALSSSAQHLALAWKPLVEEPSRHHLGEDLKDQMMNLAKALDRLKNAYANMNVNVEVDATTTDGDQAAAALKKKKKVRFLSVMSDAQNELEEMERDLDKPVVVSMVLKPKDIADLEQQLSQKLSKMNAAMASLAAVSSHRENPDYDTAESAVATVRDLMPEVIADTKLLCANQDDESRQKLLDAIKALSKATRDMCASAAQDETTLNDSAIKFANSSGQLMYIFNPRGDTGKENEIKELSTATCQKANQMSGHAHELGKVVGGAQGVELARRGDALADAAQSLLTTTQLTSTSLHEPSCQLVLLSAADDLSSSARQLATTLEPLQQDVRCKDSADQLIQSQQDLERAIELLRNLFGQESVDAEVKSPLRRAPPVPKRVPPRNANDKPISVGHTPTGGQSIKSKDLTQEFLHQLRSEEDQDLESSKNNANKKLEQQFMKAVDEAEIKIDQAVQELLKIHDVGFVVMPKLESAQTWEVQKNMEGKLAKAAVATASLVACNNPERFDYSTAVNSTTSISELMPAIAKDAVLLTSSDLPLSRDDNSRKLFVDNTKNMCDASRKLLNNAKNEKQNLNESAVELGNKLAKLLYTISSEVDPQQETEVITRAREIGDSASRLALAGAAGAARCEEDQSRILCAAGGRCADSAGALVYTAKLVAPLIQETPCQEALVSASNDLSSNLKTFSSTWKPLSSDPQNEKCVQDLTTETDNLERLLDALKRDVKSGSLIKKRQIEKLVVEDNPLRQLTIEILEEAQRKAECTDLPVQERKQFAQYYNKLSDALKALDVANARCRKSPHETSQELEKAVQNLQFVLLQSRPTNGDEIQNNVVDLTDYIRNVSAEVDKVIVVANESKVERGQQILENIKCDCHAINKDAYKLTTVQIDHQEQATNNYIDDILAVERFGQDCDERVSKMKASIQNIVEKNAKNALQEKAASLEGSCNILKFATKSALAISQSATLDETMDDLTELQKKIDKMLLDGALTSYSSTDEGGLSPWLCHARYKLVWAADAMRCGRGVGGDVTSALHQYCAEMRLRTPAAHQARLSDHIKRLLQLLKTLTASTSRRIALWQPVDDGDVITVTEEILKELENPLHLTDTKPRNGSVIRKILLPTKGSKADGDNKKLERNLKQSTAKLDSIIGTLISSVDKADSLERSTTAAVNAVVEVTSTAKALNNADPLQKRKTEEACQELSFATYNLVNTCELVSQKPNNSHLRRKLLDACRLLNEALNKLERTCESGENASGGEYGRSVRELSRRARWPRAAAPAGPAGPAAPASRAAGGYRHALHALEHHHELIQNLKNKEPMSREEFTKSLKQATGAACSAAEYGNHCAYLISISDQHNNLAKEGLVDVLRLEKLTDSVQNSILKIIRIRDSVQIKEESTELYKQVQELVQAINEDCSKIGDSNVKRKLDESGQVIESAAENLQHTVKETHLNEDNINNNTTRILNAVAVIKSVTENSTLLPVIDETQLSKECKQRSDDVQKKSSELILKVLALLKEVEGVEMQEMMTWVMFSSRTSVLDSADALIKCTRENGKELRLVDEESEGDVEEKEPNKSLLQMQVDTASRWLQRPSTKSEIKMRGKEAAAKIIETAEMTIEDLKGTDKDEMKQLTDETRQLLEDYYKSDKFDSDKASLLMERLKELRKALERTVVTRVVEDFIEDEALADLDVLADAETEETKRKFLLEKKIAELLAHLSRVTKTARFVADTGRGDPATSQELIKCANQAELLAPMLVKAAEQRVKSPDDKAAIDHYQSLLKQYAESLLKIRDFCDQAVDPMDFVQTAGETMQRIREESDQNDLQKCAYDSAAIKMLARRVISVGKRSAAAREPERARALAQAERRLCAAAARDEAHSRRSRLAHWGSAHDEILRTTGEVESVLGGETIFNKQPEPDQPIYNAALDLHAAVRGWSARDNDVVAVAKRLAVLMARLQHHMNTDKKRELIITSKAIVTESHEVAYLAKKLAMECTDMRIRNNLLQVCERVPTISHQLNMLTTVKSSSLGHQGSEEDKEAMNMLVGNAQNLMASIQEVVKAAESASVKIMSQRGGPRMKWVRKNY